MYNITVMDQYSPASVTVPANMSSVEISQFPDNGTSIVANREYNITVSTITQGRSYISEPFIFSKELCTYICVFTHMYLNVYCMPVWLCTYVICISRHIFLCIVT